jgi:hypothetical protein
MQAIQTKFLPATNYKPARIKASCRRGSITISYHNIIIPAGASAYEDGRHIAAAKALCDLFVKQDTDRVSGIYRSTPKESPWSRPFVTGQLKDQTYTHVFLPNP